MTAPRTSRAAVARNSGHDTAATSQSSGCRDAADRTSGGPSGLVEPILVLVEERLNVTDALLPVEIKTHDP